MRQVSSHSLSVSGQASCHPLSLVAMLLHIDKDYADFIHSAAMGSRRLNLIRWTAYMDECLHDLETSEEALPSDKTLCQWVKLQRLADEIGTQISADGVSHGEISDPKVQYALKGFERQMGDWKKQKPAQIASRKWFRFASRQSSPLVLRPQ